MKNKQDLEKELNSLPYVISFNNQIYDLEIHRFERNDKAEWVVRYQSRNSGGLFQSTNTSLLKATLEMKEEIKDSCNKTIENLN